MSNLVKKFKFRSIPYSGVKFMALFLLLCSYVPPSHDVGDSRQYTITSHILGISFPRNEIVCSWLIKAVIASTYLCKPSTIPLAMLSIPQRLPITPPPFIIPCLPVYPYWFRLGVEVRARRRFGWEVGHAERCVRYVYMDEMTVWMGGGMQSLSYIFSSAIMA